MQISRTFSSSSSGKLLSAVGPMMVYAIGIGLNMIEAFYVIIRLRGNVRPTSKMPSDKHESATSELSVAPMTASSVFSEETDPDTVSASPSYVGDVVDDLNHLVQVIDNDKRTVPLLERPRLWSCNCCPCSCNPVSCHRCKPTNRECRCIKIVSVIGEFICDYVRTLTRRRHGNRRLCLLVVLALTAVEALSLQSACTYVRCDPLVST